MRNQATKNRNQAPRNTAIKLALNPKVQVVAPAMYKAFRQADLHTNICRVASGYYDIGSRTLLIGQCSRELSQRLYRSRQEGERSIKGRLYQLSAIEEKMTGSKMNAITEIISLTGVTRREPRQFYLPAL